jgi:AcrR family transcriptional regulator
VGLDGLTIGRLAKDVGMSKSGLFAHFRSKDNLQLEVLNRAAELFTEKVLRPAFKLQKGEPRLHGIFENWVRYLNDDSLPGGSIFVAAAFELDDRPGVLRDYVQKAQRDLLSNIEKAAQMAIELGHFHKTCEASRFAWSLYSYVLGYHHSKRMVEDPRAEEHLRYAFEQLLESAKIETETIKKQRRQA